MLPYQDNLEQLARSYIDYLVDRDEDAIKKYLSLNFIARQKVTEQLKLIKHLPRFLYGIGFEIHLLDQYQSEIIGNDILVTPFQFEVHYSPQMNFVDLEKITITINGVVLEYDDWKIESIISDDEKHVLLNVIENLKESALVL